jgi:hypothetical protein
VLFFIFYLRELLKKTPQITWSNKSCGPGPTNQCSQISTALFEPETIAAHILYRKYSYRAHKGSKPSANQLLKQATAAFPPLLPVSGAPHAPPPSQPLQPHAPNHVVKQYALTASPRRFSGNGGSILRFPLHQLYVLRARPLLHRSDRAPTAGR